MATFPVKYYYGGSGMAGSTQADYPKLTNSAGSLVALLDAVLVTGYGEKSVTSISIDADHIATVNCNSHNYSKNARFEIRGADQTNLNGEWEIRSVVNSNSFTFSAPVSLANTSASGTITIRVPPLDWDKSFSATNQAVYRAKVGNRHFLYVDDTFVGVGLSCAQVRVFENMDNISQSINDGWLSSGETSRYVTRHPTTTGKTINDLKAVSWLHHVGSAAGYGGSSTDINWTIIGCDRFFYLSIHNGVANNADPMRTPYMFGDFPSLKLDDATNVLIRGADTFDGPHCYSTDYYRRYGHYFYFQGWHGQFLASNFTQNSNCVFWAIVPPYQGFDRSNSSSPVGTFRGNNSTSGPNLASGGYIFAGPCHLFEDNTADNFANIDYAVMRGFMPGFYVIPSNFLTSGAGISLRQNQLMYDSSGRKYMAMATMNVASSSYTKIGFHFISLDENWFDMPNIGLSI